MAIPLSVFQLQTTNGFQDISPTNDELVFGMLSSSPAPDRGWVIDDFDVKRGGPGNSSMNVWSNIQSGRVTSTRSK